MMKPAGTIAPIETQPQVQASQPESAAAGSTPSLGATLAALTLLCASWIVSGGCGLVGRPLSHALVWFAIALVAVALPRVAGSGWPRRLLLTLGIAAAVILGASHNEVVNLLGLAVLGGAACAAGPAGWLALRLLPTATAAPREAPAAGGCPVDWRVIRIASQAVMLLAIYRFALAAIPWVWHLADWAGAQVGNLAAALWSRPISVGATYAGLDHLVLMAALVAGWLRETPRPRLRRAILAVSAILSGQMLYLLCLSFAKELAAALPEAPARPPADLYVPPAWFWGDGLRSLLPWNLPILAVVWQLAVAAAMLRWTQWTGERQGAAAENPTAPEPAGESRTRAKRSRPRATVHTPTPSANDWLAWVPAGLALILPLVAVFSPGRADLAGKTILVFDQGFIDWDVPEHGRYGADSAGRFGMLPAFVESLGGRLVRSSKLEETELAAADVLVLLHPNRPWPKETLERVWDFVRQGGSLLVTAGPRLQDAQGASSFNEVLQPLGMEVRFDTTVSETESWRQAIVAAPHPTTLGLRGDRDRFGTAMAASIDICWRAWPILVGRWGWSDPGSDFLLTSRAEWDAGERLGDLVLAAERRVGRGRILTLGDTGCLTNSGTVRAYRFTGRLLAYLAGKAAAPQAWWRQLAGLLAVLGLSVLVVRGARPETIAISGLLLAGALLAAESISCRAWEVLPDGRRQTPNNLAYLSASHLEAYAESPWVPDGIDGLALTLMRERFLVLLADDLSPQRLERAAMLLCVAPAREFKAGEQAAVGQFVERGGVLVAMAGAVEGRKIRSILEPFGLGTSTVFRRPGAGGEDAAPLGCLYLPYPETENFRSTVVFYAAWPVHIHGQSAYTIACTEDKKPVVAAAAKGKGFAVVIGDTCFGLNKTLENEDGAALVGERVNANFWRWFVGGLPGRQPWQPPAYDPSKAAPSEAANKADAERSERHEEAQR